jgi:GMP synthase-like glutamine amidotransferase
VSSNLTASATPPNCTVKSVAVIQHVANDGPSYFATWLKQRGVPLQVFHMYCGDSLPADINAHSGLCILGGPMSANDPVPYFDKLRQMVRDAIQLDVPVIGHCLGGQLMSRALGGTVQASDNVEIGWGDLQTTHPAASEWIGSLTPLRLFQWHSESFTIPPGATQILRGQHCVNQAFVLGGRHLGMQFHCEVDAVKVQEWLLAGAVEMQHSTSPAVGDAQAILRTLDKDIAHSQHIASRLYSRWAIALKN